MGHLEIASTYLFGDVKFLHLLLLLMGVDILTGLAKGYKDEILWSRKSLFGFARKLLVLSIIIVANVIDQVLGLNGAITYATVLFYIANEGLSITENLAVLGVAVPPFVAQRLHAIDGKSEDVSEGRDEGSITEEVKDELLGVNVNDEIKESRDNKRRKDVDVE